MIWKRANCQCSPNALNTDEKKQRLQRRNNILPITLKVYDTYHKSNLVYAGFFPQFLIFHKNNSAQTFMIIFFYLWVLLLYIEKLNIVEKKKLL